MNYKQMDDVHLHPPNQPNLGTRQKDGLPACLYTSMREEMISSGGCISAAMSQCVGDSGGDGQAICSFGGVLGHCSGATVLVEAGKHLKLQ